MKQLKTVNNPYAIHDLIFTGFDGLSGNSNDYVMTSTVADHFLSLNSNPNRYQQSLHVLLFQHSGATFDHEVLDMIKSIRTSRF